MGMSSDRDLVLVLSVYDVDAADMLPLDTNCCTAANAFKLGITHPICTTTSCVPADAQSSVTKAQVICFNVRIELIGLTLFGSTGLSESFRSLISCPIS